MDTTKNKKGITVADLQDQIGTLEPRPILHCDICDSEYSAHAGDYWDHPKDYVFTCCGEPMSLVIKRKVYMKV
jgi:hypothetical protein